MDKSEKMTLTRRSVLISGAALASSPLLNVSGASSEAVSDSEPAKAVTSQFSLEVNGIHRELDIDVRTTLLDALREHLNLGGSKKGCDHGQCGACTVLVDGVRINACLSLAVMHARQSITTVEGLGTPTSLHPIQAAFIKHDGFQCGYCTPGQICSAVGVLDEIKRGVPSHVSTDLADRESVSLKQIQERMSGNLCRCGAYANITKAVLEIAEGVS